jgi:His/Glu/Gln/Arg/opine family amino acid ABC transporter permease subunit
MPFDIYFVRDQFPTFLYYGAVSLALCLAALVIGIAIGAVLCLMHFSRLKTLNGVASVLVGVVRALPELVLIFWLYSCLPLITGVTLSALSTGLISLSLFAAAYLSEIFRAGLLAISVGQREAGYSLGLSRLMVLRLIVLPQATRIMIGPLLNFMCDLVKVSTLLSALSIGEMSFYASALGAETYKYLEIYTMVGVIYFVVIFAMSASAKKYIARRELVVAS